MADADGWSRTFADAVNARDWDAVRAGLADGAVLHHAAGVARGPEEIVDLYRVLSERLGWRITVLDVAATATMAAVLHTDSFADGDHEMCTVARIDGDVATELWTVGMPDDALPLEGQIG